MEPIVGVPLVAGGVDPGGLEGRREAEVTDLSYRGQGCRETL
jgi:hypothetical protein